MCHFASTKQLIQSPQDKDSFLNMKCLNMQSDIYMASAEEIQTVMRTGESGNSGLIFKFIPMPKHMT